MLFFAAIVKICKIVVTRIINTHKTRYQRKSTYMNKPRLLIFLLSAIFLIQSCKKDTVSAVAYTTAAFQANINGSAWAPDTISTRITYNPDTKTKSFFCSGIKDQKEVIFSVTLNNSSNTPGFALGTYPIDSLNGVWAQFKTLQQDTHGNYIYLQHGQVEKGSGSVIITAVDSVKKQITGTFAFYSRATTYDNDGNVLSISVDNITGGAFTNLPYTFFNSEQ